MGNDVSKGSNHMAIAAMAHVTHLEARELLMLQKKFAELARREGNPQNISREHFEEALQLVGITENDKEILDRLFIMFDISGDNQINFREFLAGIAPLASGSTADKLNLAFQLYDVHGTGEVNKTDLFKVLSSLNSTASYFGDAVMARDEMEALVEDVFRSDGRGDSSHGGGGGASLGYGDSIQTIVDHPVVTAFVSGGGSVRFGMGK